MIVPKKNSKSYGVVHIKKDFSFIGFCKDSTNETLKFVDVYINDRKIDTLIANKYFESLDNIYDCGNSCFEFFINNKYLNDSTILTIKESETNELLSNCPISFNNSLEFKYHSLTNSIKLNTIEESTNFTPNVISFFAVKEYLNNEKFTKFLEELKNELPNIKFKPIVYNEFQKELLSKLNIDKKSIIPISPIDINHLSKDIEFFIYSLVSDLEIQVVNSLRNSFKNISTIHLDLNRWDSSFYDIEKTFTNPFLDKPNFFEGFETSIKKYSTYTTIYFNMLDPNLIVSSNITSKEFVKLQISNSFNNKKFKKNLRDINIKLNKYYKS